jgi:hypothetical protein
VSGGGGGESRPLSDFRVAPQATTAGEPAVHCAAREYEKALGQGRVWWTSNSRYEALGETGMSGLRQALRPTSAASNTPRCVMQTLSSCRWGVDGPREHNERCSKTSKASFILVKL